ncbi:DNA sulfur modification protein DndB [Thaumasiovibrio sp. DFM-14]|uniref:DNA sulfur modification protein DndB n=1 Tax=Thaumasiovibrio sp. DFM-14 TaxID=3384792 RepID=UPI0039A04163
MAGFTKFENIDSTAKQFDGLYGFNLGNPRLLLLPTLNDLLERAQVYNLHHYLEDDNLSEDEAAVLVAQRPLYKPHAISLAKFILGGMYTMQLNDWAAKREKQTEAQKRRAQVAASPEAQEALRYVGEAKFSALQPIVMNIRGCGENGDELNPHHPIEKKGNNEQELKSVFRITLASGHVFSIIDGQHRFHALLIIRDWLRDICAKGVYPKAGLFNLPTGIDGRVPVVMMEFWRALLDKGLNQVTLSAEVFMGLSLEQERQHFVHLNTKGKNASIETALDFDSQDPVNQFIKKELTAMGHLKWGHLKLKTLNQICCLLVANKQSSKSIRPVDLDNYQGFLLKFWQTVQNAPGVLEPNAESESLLLNPVMLKAIAKLGYDLSKKKDKKGLIKLWTSIEDGSLDFSHNNKHWQAICQPQSEWSSLIPKMTLYVHPPKGKPLDAGRFDPDTKKVIFSTKQNDTYPRLADLIRLQLGLQSRHKSS